MTRGQFITFEGIDGAGKTTQIEAFEAFLKKSGIEFIHTREPGGTPLGESIRTMLLHEAMTPMTETLLFFAARSEHIAKVILPALEAGKWVVSDRFTDATYAYQVGGKGFPSTAVCDIESLVQGSLQPDHTVLFDLDPEIAAKRLSKARTADRFEQENAAFFSAVRQAYLDRAKADPKRFFILDAGKTPEIITSALLQEVATWL